MTDSARRRPSPSEHPHWDRWVERMYTEDQAPYGIPKCLHHYTLHDVVMSILQSSVIRATDASRLEDSTELRHGIPACLEALETVVDRRLAPYLPILRAGIEERFLNRTFVSCYSTASDLKSQWDAYADSQKGYAIGFDVRCLSDLAPPLGLRLMPVEYGPSDQQRRAQRAAASAVRDIKEAEQLPVPFEFTVHARAVLLGIDMFYLCSTFKSETFRPEQEWRLVYTIASTDSQGLPVKVSESGVPFVEISLTHTYHGPQPIYAAIREGPLTPPESAEQIQRLIRECNIKTRWEKQPAFA